MEALVKERADTQGLLLKDVPKPVIKSGQALVRIGAVGVCGTDVHIYAGDVKINAPIVVGHEFSGTVEEIIADREDIKPGDKVVSRLNIGVCGICRACITGNPHMCEHRTCPGFAVDGAYAEYIAIDARQLVRLEDSVELTDAALVEPMAIVAHALFERSRIEAEDTVVIYGPGPIGLIALQMAKMNGASNVIMVGTDVDLQMRIPAAEKLGADVIINAQQQDAAQIINELTEGKGADLVIEASGAEPAINSGIDILRRQGRMCVLGLPTQDKNLIKWLRAAEKSLQIVFNYSSSPLSWNMAVSMLNRGAFRTDEIITARLPLSQFKTMFDKIAKGEIIKGVFLP